MAAAEDSSSAFPLAEFTIFQAAERHCRMAIWKAQNVKAVGTYEIKRWSEVLRPQLEAAFAKCEQAGMHAGGLEEIRTRIGILEAEWKLLCEDRDSVAPAPTAMGARVDPFKTGAAGRPPATHFVVNEAKRRITSGEVVPKQGSLAQFSEDLAAWWEEKRHKFEPAGPPLTAGSIETAVRDLWRHAIGTPRN